MNPVKRTYNNILQVVKLLKMPRRFSTLLADGTYRYNESCTTLYHVDKKNLEEGTSAKLFGTISASKNPLRTLFSNTYRYRNHNTEKLFNGQLAVISTMEKDVKVFDFNRSQVLTCYESEARKNDIVRKRLMWANTFRTIPFTCINGNMTKELLVEKNDFDSVRAYEVILGDYSKHLKIANGSAENINEVVNEDLLAECLTNIGKPDDVGLVMEYLSSSNYKVCLTHGDLWRSNLIFDGKDYFYIDFEQVKSRFFLYDLMTYIFLDYFLLNDKRLIKKYLSGGLDDNMKYLFECANVEYDRNLREIYLEISIYTMYIERWHGNDSCSHLLDKIRTRLCRLEQNQ